MLAPQRYHLDSLWGRSAELSTLPCRLRLEHRNSRSLSHRRSHYRGSIDCSCADVRSPRRLCALCRLGCSRRGSRLPLSSLRQGAHGIEDDIGHAAREDSPHVPRHYEFRHAEADPENDQFLHVVMLAPLISGFGVAEIQETPTAAGCLVKALWHQIENGADIFAV